MLQQPRWCRRLQEVPHDVGLTIWMLLRYADWEASQLHTQWLHHHTTKKSWRSPLWSYRLYLLQLVEISFKHPPFTFPRFELDRGISVVIYLLNQYNGYICVNDPLVQQELRAEEWELWHWWNPSYRSWIVQGSYQLIRRLQQPRCCRRLQEVPHDVMTRYFELEDSCQGRVPKYLEFSAWLEGITTTRTMTTTLHDKEILAVPIIVVLNANRISNKKQSRAWRLCTYRWYLL